MIQHRALHRRAGPAPAQPGPARGPGLSAVRRRIDCFPRRVFSSPASGPATRFNVDQTGGDTLGAASLYRLTGHRFHLAISSDRGAVLNPTCTPMTTHAILGLDAAQAGVAFHLQQLDAHLLAQGRCAASTAGWNELTAMLKTHHLGWADCLVAIESTGQWHLPWAEAAAKAGATVYALNPLIAKRVRSVGNAIRDQKSDPLDAAALAETLARYHAALARFIYQSRPANFRLRRLLTARRAVRSALTNLRKSAGDLQDLCFPELADSDLSTERQRRLLRTAAHPAAVLALPAARLQELAGEHAKTVRTLARSSFAPATLAAAAAPALQALLETDAELSDRLEELDRQIAIAAAEGLDPVQLQRARTVPGFGDRTTPAILACIPPDLFVTHTSHRSRANALQALFGCEPRLLTSGKWTGKIKISKRGIREARTALYQAAFSTLANEPDFKSYYDRLRARGKSHKTALVDIMRKLLRRLVAALDPAAPPSTAKTPCVA